MLTTLPRFPDGGPSDSRPFRWPRAATLFLAAAGAIYFLWLARTVLPPFLIAFFLAALLDPVVSRFERQGMARARAVLMIYALIFLLILLALLLILPAALGQLNDLGRNSHSYIEDVKTWSEALYQHYAEPLSAVGVDKNPFKDGSGPLAKAAAGALAAVQGTLVAFSGQALWLVIIPLSLFYFLMGFGALRAKIIYLFPESHQPQIDTMSREIVEVFSTYFRSLAEVCALYGASAAILFYWLGLRYSLFLGLAAGVLYAVPYIGPLITTGTAAVIALIMNPVAIAPTSVTLSPTAYAILVVVLFLALHFTFDYGITPKLVGGSVGLHPLVNIFALMCGATLFGITGMLLAVPVAASIQLLLVYFFPKLAARPPTAPISAVVAATPDELAVGSRQ